MRNRFPPAVVPAAFLFAALAMCPTRTAATPAGLFEFTLVPLGSDTQSWPTINLAGPYFYFRLTNEAAVADSFHMAVENLTQPGWFPQVCLRQICFPTSATIRVNGFASDSVGVNIIPFFDGLGEADFRVTSVGDPSLTSVFHVRLYAGTAAVGADPLARGPVSLQLSPSFPNPVRQSARIAFVLPQRDQVSLRLYDVMGRQVATLVDASLPAGPHSVEWHGLLAGGRAAAAGTYYYRLETSDGALSRRLVLLR